MREIKDTDIIDAFVAYLERNGHPGLKVNQRPDTKNRNSPDIDAIAGSFAIEHTRIDTLLNQSRNNDWFGQVIDGLEQALSWQLSIYLRVGLDYNAITTGQDWPGIKHALRTWILNESQLLKDGHHVLNNIPGIPFTLHVDKAATNPPGRLSFSRFDPNDNTLPCRIKKLFNRKANKLARYQGCGTTTVLLIESYDSALMNESKMVTKIRDAYPNGLPSGVDKFWYAPNTSIPAPIKFRDITANLLSVNYPTKKSWLEEIEDEFKER